MGLFISHFCVKIYLNLKASLLDKSEHVKHPAQSVIPAIQKSDNVGLGLVSKGTIVGIFCFKSFSFKKERKVKNLA